MVFMTQPKKLRPSFFPTAASKAVTDVENGVRRIPSSMSGISEKKANAVAARAAAAIVNKEGNQ
jgi:hypothetical protein